jgi:hypothetical protein
MYAVTPLAVEAGASERTLLSVTPVLLGGTNEPVIRTAIAPTGDPPLGPATTVAVAVGVAVCATVPVGVAVAIRVGVAVLATVAVGVAVATTVLVAVGVETTVIVAVGVLVRAGVLVAVGVGPLGVTDGVSVGVTFGL